MNTRYVLTLCTALVVGGALLIGSAHALDKADVTTPMNDTWLTAKTKIALAADGRVKGRQIDVETTKGQVMLRGKVDTDSAKQAAEDITKRLDGVKTVKNDLEVVAPATRDAVEDKDDAITTRVKPELFEAFERNDLSGWPRGLYARACVAQGARVLAQPARQRLKEIMDSGRT